MKIIDWEPLLFRVNGLVIVAVIALTVPTTRIVASWYPDRKEVLWLFPVGVLAVTSLIWLLLRMATAWLIRWGVYEDRRKKSRHEKKTLAWRLMKMLVPTLAFAAQVLLLIFLGMCLVEMMEGRKLMELFIRV